MAGPPLADDPFAAAPATDGGGGAGGGFHIGEYLQIARRHWRLIAAIVLIFTAGGVTRYFMTPKVYRSTATIQIERRSLINVTTTEANPWLENYWNQEFYPTQYRLLQSRGLAERVVRLLRLDEDPGAATTTGGAAGAVSAAEDEARVGAIAGGLLGGLAVNPIPNTMLVEISYVAGSAEFAARAANAFAEAFIDMGIETRSSTASKASDLLGSEIELLKREIADRERQLQAFSSRADIVSLDPAGNVVMQRLGALSTEYNGAVSERINRAARYQEMLNTPPEVLADSLAEGRVGSMRSELMTKRREYDTKLKDFKPEYPPLVKLKNEIDKLATDLDKITLETVAQAREKARAELQTAQRLEAAILAQLERAKTENMQLNAEAIEYNNLNLEISTRKSKLNDLLRRQSDTDVTSRLQGTRESNVRIIDRALVPGGPFAPSLRRDASMGMLAGLVLGIGLVALLEFLDRTIKSPEQLERLLGLPTLAVIPDVSETPSSGYGYGGYGYGYGYGSRSRRSSPRAAKARKEGSEVPAEAAPIELLPHAKPRLVASEAYRGLRTALLLSSADELKVVGVTSSQSGEGKTATSANLAVVMAQLGKQVLLIDGDLRKPRIHEVFRISNRLGLVNYLTGSAKAEHVFLRSEIPNLWVTPSGPIPPNPSELLSSHRMREFLALARSSFDFVVVDTPPVLAVTDATVVGSMTDGLVLCLRARKVQQDDARSCRERLRMAEVRILGTVLNRYRETQGGYGRRYHSYLAYAEAAEQAKSGSAA